MAETPTATPVAFGPADRGLLGLYHRPAGALTRSMGIVMCNPLGYEAMCVHRTYRHFAGRLAAQGFPTLRFDYHGTGDSSGDSGAPSRVRAWLDSIGAAIDELRERTALESIGLFGVRFGATLAALAAGERQDVDSLILWAPCCSGRAYVRELRAFRLMQQRDAGSPRIDGDLEVAGYLLDRQTATDISDLDLFASSARIAKRVFIIARDDLAGDEGWLASHLEAEGVQFRLATQPGYASMMRDAQDSVAPIAVLDAMVAWLGEVSRPAPQRYSPSRVTSPVLRASSRNGGRVREQAFRFGEDQRLLGILTEPADRPVLDGPAILLLNAGANHRVGPNRMYVSMARDLAARGYLVFRFDVGGLGDSGGAPEAQGNRLYSKDSIPDVKTAMDFLGSVRGARRFLLLGLCSGAYLAFHTTMEDPRVVGQALLNPQTFEWNEGDSLELSTRRSFLSTRYYASALFEPLVWRRALSGGINFRGILGVLTERLMERIQSRGESLRAKVQGLAEPQTQVERAFVQLSDRGVETLLVFSFNDGGLDMIEKHLGRNIRRVSGRKNVHVAIVRGADHTFTPIGSQQALYDIVTRYVTESFR